TTARDRDRLRDEVLDKLGWRIHRVWSPDWLYRRKEEVERLRQLLADASRGVEPPKPAVSVVTDDEPVPPPRKVEVGSPAENGGRLPGAVAYRPCELKVDKRAARADFHAAGVRKELCRLLNQLVKAEGPIHVDVATRRLREAWKLGNTKDRVRRTVEEAVRA